MNTDIIAARRQAIRDAAPCECCGATLAACKAARGKDPTAPPWFGCCAQGIEMRPCHHVPDAGALSKLLDEIESGAVRTVEEATPKPAKPGLTWVDYLAQGEQWKPSGRPMVAIADMDPEWRYNASRWLERKAPVIALRYTLAEAFDFIGLVHSPTGPSEMAADSIQDDMDRAAAERRRDPVAWIRATKLHKALVAGLPTKQKKLARLGERAKHWSTCPARTGDGDCRCEQIRAQHDTEQEEAHGVPEWTS